MAEFQKIFTLKDRYIRIDNRETGCFLDVMCEHCDTQLIKVYGFDFQVTGKNLKGQPTGYPTNYSPNHPKSFIECPNCHARFKESDIFQGVFDDGLDI